MTTEQETHESPLPWARYIWPALVVALLLGHVVIVTGALVLSTALIPAATVAPSGYAEALAWDDLKAAQAESDRLGWTLSMAASEGVDSIGNNRVELQLVDRDGAPIADAEVFAKLYHHSRPGNVIEASIPYEPATDLYAAALPLRREGQWRLSVIARRGGVRFLEESDFWMPATTGGP